MSTALAQLSEQPTKERIQKIIWTDEMRMHVSTLKKAGLLHREIAQKLELSMAQVYWGWKLYRESAPSRCILPRLTTADIRAVSALREKGRYRREIAQEMGLSIARVDRAIALGRKQGINMTLNPNIYRERQRENALIGSRST